MTTLSGFAGWPRGDLHLAIGVFDGVHRGHRTVIGRLRDGAHAAGARALAATFDPLPAAALRPELGPLALTTATDRAALLHAAGADDVTVFGFDAAFASLAAAEFAARLAAAGDVRRIVVGPDFQFGRGRSGRIATLRAEGARHGFTVDVVEPVREGGEVVSSTRIRGLLRAGDVAGAAALLGRRHRLPATVVRGDRRGTGLGWPTVNLAPPPELLLPADGIYAMWVFVGGVRHPAAASLGVRPTFGDALERRLEAHLIDFSGDLYDATVTCELVARLRGELRFPSGEALAAQIAEDVRQTRHLLAEDA